MQSGAEITRVSEGYLKTSTGALIESGRRELAFYRDVAPSLPCRTPALLGSENTADGVRILLADAGAEVPARSWTPAMWAAAGEQLALLHGSPLPAGDDWWRPDVLDAYDRDLAVEFWGPGLPALVAARRRPAATVLTHGDCHTGNVVFDRHGRPTLCDWASAVVGRAATDLAFFTVRAVPDGIVAPDELLTAYAEGTGVEPDVLAREVAAEELAILVLLWPPYAAFNSPDGVERVRRRAKWLAAA